MTETSFVSELVSLRGENKPHPQSEILVAFGGSFHQFPPPPPPPLFMGGPPPPPVTFIWKDPPPKKGGRLLTNLFLHLRFTGQLIAIPIILKSLNS